MRQHHVHTNGILLHVSELGAGPPVLFCHGFPATAVSWRSQMEAVATAGYRVLAPDMRGYGGSDAPAEVAVYTPFHTVGDLVGLLDHFDLPRCTVVGHDFGASVAWNAAMMRPDRFAAVFGLSVPYQPLGGPSFLDQIRAAGKTDFYMFAQMPQEADAQWADAAVTIPGCYYWTSGQAPADTRWEPFDPRRGLLRPAPEPLTGIDPGYLAEAVAAFARTGFHGPLNYYRAIDGFYALAAAPFAGRKLHQPAWFLTGADDGLRAFHPAENAMRQALPDLRGYTVLEGVGHWPQWEAAERVNAALLAFLAQASEPRLEEGKR